MIKAVLFDVDGVLIDSFEANFSYIKRLAELFTNKDFTREEYLKAFHQPFKQLIQNLIGFEKFHSVEEIVDEAKKYEVYYDSSQVSLPNGIHETLKELKNHYQLGIVTSRRKETANIIPQLKELFPLFTTLVFIEDVENHKPHPEPLLLAAKRLGVDPKECVYVGDAETDMHAAEAAGMYMITFADDVKGSATIATQAFHELPELIEKLS